MDNLKKAHYFVDESGDGVLFNAKGQVLIGQHGHVNHFMLGLLEVSQPDALAADLHQLRSELLADPYFKNVPSLQIERRRTALAFHAKDDLPEVRREVFKVLLRHDMKFFAVVRDLHSVLAYVRERNARDTRYRYQPNELYDSSVSRLFKDRLHRYESCHICFALRGSSDRTQAFKSALEVARSRFEQKWAREVKTEISVVSGRPGAHPGLQAVDYLLWALQRHYGRSESRFLELLWDKVGLIHAVDETGEAPYGRYYSKTKPLV